MRAYLMRMLVPLGLLGSLTTTVWAQDPSSRMDNEQVLRLSLAHLLTQAREIGIQNPPQEFRLRQVVRDAMGQIQVRLDQVHQGIFVFGQQLIVHLNRDGSLLTVTGAFQVGITASTQPSLSPQEAQNIAQDEFPGPFTAPPEVQLVLFPLDEGVVRVHREVVLRNGEVRLVYRVVLKDAETPRRIVAFVDAITGELVHSYNALQTVSVTGTGHSLYSGTVTITTEFLVVGYFMWDRPRGGLLTYDVNNMTSDGFVFFSENNIWGDGTTADRASAGVDAHFGAEMTWDYYRTVHGRNGIFDNGVGPQSSVHYKSNYNNAHWDPNMACGPCPDICVPRDVYPRVSYGDGDGSMFNPFVSLDTVGHEITHGVTQATACLIEDKQAYGLEESMSDIFGTMVEFFAFAATRGATKTPNYLIGEDWFTPGIPGDAFRYMDNPTRDGRSIDTFLDYRDTLDGHYTSGIANNAFFLLAEGGTHRRGCRVSGIGREKAEKIFYRALTSYMIPSETFAMARGHTLRAAQDLFGIGSPEVVSVAQAWSAVGVPPVIIVIEPPPLVVEGLCNP